jgi:VIT1/CCC1 family predicted Fe2+/Mn2+ transporter
MAARQTPPPDPRGADVQRVDPQFRGTAGPDTRPGHPPPGKSPAAAASSAKHLSGFSAGLGAWLIAAPFLLAYEFPGATTNDIVCGLLVLVLGITRYAKPLSNVWASWTNAGIGAWLVAAPFVLLPYSFGTFWNDIAVGLLLVVTGASSALATARYARDPAYTGAR